MHILRRGGTVALWLLAASAAAAQEYPVLAVDADLAFQSEKIVSAANRRNASNSFAQIEAGIGLLFTEEFSLQSRVKFEPVRSTTASRFMEDHGLWAEELFLDYQGEWFDLFAGKFNPRFGTAWDRLSDLFQKRFAEDYERTEGLGIGATLKHETLGWGDHELGAALFHFDNTFLSNSAFARPAFGNPDTIRVKRNRDRFGGPGNTDAFSSYTLTLDGDGFPGLDGLSYHLGHSRLARGTGNADAEKGYVAALRWALDAGQGITVTPLAELAHFRNAQGGPDRTTYLTTALELGWQDWRLTGMRTSRHVNEPSDGSSTFGYDYTDTLLSLLLSYTFDFGLEVAVAWSRQQVEGESILHAIGARFAYGLKF